MKAGTLSQSTSRIRQPAPYPLDGLTKTSTRKTAVLVGRCFLVATFTFAIGSAHPFAPLERDVPRRDPRRRRLPSRLHRPSGRDERPGDA